MLQFLMPNKILIWVKSVSVFFYTVFYRVLFSHIKLLKEHIPKVSLYGQSPLGMCIAVSDNSGRFSP